MFCRTTTIPYFDDDIQKEIENTRMARDVKTGKSVRVENLTYKDWFDRYVKDPKDEEEYNNIVNILGYKVVENLEKYKDIKYNDGTRYNDIKKDFNVIRAILNNEKIIDKNRGEELYYSFKENKIYSSDHFIENFINREFDKNGKAKFDFETIINIVNKEINYIDIRNNRSIRYYNNISVISENEKYITLMYRKKVSPNWKKVSRDL